MEYTRPKIKDIIEIEFSYVLCSSEHTHPIYKRHICSEKCKDWCICGDKEEYNGTYRFCFKKRK